MAGLSNDSAVIRGARRGAGLPPPAVNPQPSPPDTRVRQVGGELRVPLRLSPADEALQSRLLLMLSHLESLRAQLAGQSVRQPAVLIGVMTAMLDEVVGVAERHL